jgi:hypothetical protein
MLPALVISASQNKVEAGTEFRSFEQIVSTGRGLSYAISDPDRRKIRIGCKLVILDNARGKRAEAKLTELKLDEKTRTGMQRYNVYFEGVEQVDYQYDRIERWGTSVIDLA